MFTRLMVGACCLVMTIGPALADKLSPVAQKPEFWMANEFWAAIAGAMVGAIAGGIIAYMVQVKALREGRNQRDEDHKQAQQALGNSLLFKMIGIYSNCDHLHKHFEDCYAMGEQDDPEHEPWQFITPIANLPLPVHFSSEEMGMLLSLKNDDVFNAVITRDSNFNSLFVAVDVLNTERQELTEKLKADETEGNTVTSFFSTEVEKALRPKMIRVNTLADGIRDRAIDDLKESHSAMDGLHQVLSDRLGITYKIVQSMEPKNSSD